MGNKLITLAYLKIHPLLGPTPVSYTYDEYKLLFSFDKHSLTFDGVELLPESPMSLEYQIQHEMRRNISNRIDGYSRMKNFDGQEELLNKLADRYNETIDALYLEPLENMPLYLNKFSSCVARFRIEVRK
jgi:hypothetical protein